MQKAAVARGYDLSAQRARQVRAADFGEFDLILAMDADNLANLERMRPAKAGGAVVRLFTDYVAGADHVPDPYFTRDFDGALDLIERCAEALLDEVAAEG
jgi:protein-tyrosine phosphatase